MSFKNVCALLSKQNHLLAEPNTLLKLYEVSLGKCRMGYKEPLHLWSITVSKLKGYIQFQKLSIDSTYDSNI